MKVRGGRALLNGPGFHSTAAIVAEVEDTRDWKDGCDRDGDKLGGSYSYSAEPDGEFVISDCSRAVSLDADWQTEAGRRNTLEKVDRMLAVLSDYRDGLVVEQERYVRRVERAKAEEPNVGEAA